MMTETNGATFRFKFPRLFREFFDAYVECALWSSVDDCDDGITDEHCVDDIDHDTLRKMRDDADKFIEAHYDDIEDNLAGAGHDFWLTRNGHGAGFWDGDWPDSVGQRLTAACNDFGTCELYVGDDGKIYF